MGYGSTQVFFHVPTCENQQPDLVPVPRGHERGRVPQGFMRVLVEPAFHQVALLAIVVLLLLGSTWISWQQSQSYASPDRGICTWYRIRHGDTLSAIARRYHTSVGALARANAIHRPGLIISGKRLCIPRLGYHDQVGHSGLHRNGTVKWFAYSALQQSTRPQVEKLLRRAAARHHLPASLVLAIAWQESGWNQHIIGRDGGVGVMQLMPYTARGLNIQVRGRHDPYKLSGNIELGVVYLHTLWTNFHGNTTKVISAYNEGGWNVVHRGIYNWRYVNNVRALMRRFH